MPLCRSTAIVRGNELTAYEKAARKIVNWFKVPAATVLLASSSGCVSLRDCDYGGTYGVDERGAYVTGKATCPIRGSSTSGTITCTGTYWLETGEYEGSCQ